MAWNTVGNLRGPIGPQGVSGVGIDPNGTTIDGDGNLVVTFTDGTTNTIGKVVGKDGVDGKSVAIQGSVPSSADLPTGLAAADAGKGYITSDDGHLHIWDGDSFNDVGEVRGPKGDQGIQGLQGIPGTKWFTGSGAPSGAIAGARPDDKYLDLDTGDVYTYS